MTEQETIELQNKMNAMRAEFQQWWKKYNYPILFDNMTTQEKMAHEHVAWAAWVSASSFKNAMLTSKGIEA